MLVLAYDLCRGPVRTVLSSYVASPFESKDWLAFFAWTILVRDILWPIIRLNRLNQAEVLLISSGI